MNFFYIFFLILLTLNEACKFSKKQSKISLLNNGYENIVIAINNDVPENFEIINRIRNVFKELSSLLFNATRNRAYFKEIKILIPKNWKLNYFNGRKISYSSWETIDKSDFCIEKRDAHVSTIPYVLNYAGECGDHGLNIHLAIDYLFHQKRSIQTYGSYKNVLLRLWAQFRYGVFDEVAYNFENGDYYFNSEGEIEANRCSINNKGTLRDAFSSNGKCTKFLPNGLPDVRCIFEDDIINLNDNNYIPFGSLMYKSYLPQINSFCEDNLKNPNLNHNSFAPTLHNKICKGKSIWNILDNHHDFNNGKNKPNFDLKNTDPTFTVLKQSKRRIVLIIDRSLVNDPKALLALNKSLEDLVNIMFREGDLIGIIHFDIKSKIVLGFTEFSENNKNNIYKKAVPNIGVTNKTNLWSALKLGVIMSKNTISYSQDGTNFILITNAKVDHNYPNRIDVYEMLKVHHIIVDTIGFSNEADFNLELLAAHTNGYSFRLSETWKYFDLTSAFEQIFNRNTDIHEQMITTHNEYDTVQKQDSIIRNVFIDDDISKREDSLTRFQFKFFYSKYAANIKILEPVNNRSYSIQDNENCKQGFFFLNNQLVEEHFCFFQKPSSGIWTIIITNPYFDSVPYHFTVTSYIGNPKKELNNIEIINIEASWKESIINIEASWKESIINYPSMQALYVTVTKSFKPVLNAKVHAFIMKPNEEPVFLDLFDDGLFSDRYKNDGIYSRYFTAYNDNGPYSAHVIVTTGENTVVHKKKVAGTQFIKTIHPTLKTFHILNEDSTLITNSFERSLSVGSFLLKNYIGNYDLIAPGCINDFKLESSNINELIFEFSFTAPGDDGDFGKSSKYEIKLMNDPIALIYYENSNYEIPNNFTIPTNNNNNDIQYNIIKSTFNNKIEPNEYGHEETFIIKLNYIKESMFSIKIRAIDASNNKGEWSPICTISLLNKNKLAKGIRDYENHVSIGKIKENFDKDFILIRNKKIIISLIFVSIILLMSLLILILILLIKFDFIKLKICEKKPEHLVYI